MGFGLDVIKIGLKSVHWFCGGKHLTRQHLFTVPKSKDDAIRQGAHIHAKEGARQD
jgi:predicted RecA/RadA family phage recombinase